MVERPELFYSFVITNPSFSFVHGLNDKFRNNFVLKDKRHEKQRMKTRYFLQCIRPYSAGMKAISIKRSSRVYPNRIS